MDPTFSSRCTHLLCESQVSGLFAQVSGGSAAMAPSLSLSLDSVSVLSDSGDGRVWKGLFSTSANRKLLLTNSPRSLVG